MTQHIHEGTPQELAPFLAERPTGRFRLIQLEEDQEPTPPPNEAKPIIDAENAAAIALLKSWREQDATDDPEEPHKAEEELAEFKRNLNANRAATGERLVYP
jgi:hypothetical protein